MEAVQPVESNCTGREGDDSDSDNDCISITEPTPPTLIEATEAVRVLRDYGVLTFDESGAREKEFLLSLSEMEVVFLRVQAKEQRQSKLEEYYFQCNAK